MQLVNDREQYEFLRVDWPSSWDRGRILGVAAKDAIRGLLYQIGMLS